MIKEEIEKYLNDNHLSYNNAVRNDVCDLVGVGDLVYNKTKELQEKVEQLQAKIDELEKSHIELLKIAKHYIKNHDYIVIANAEKLTNQSKKK